jgi:hypothetical protein
MGKFKRVVLVLLACGLPRLGSIAYLSMHDTLTDTSDSGILRSGGGLGATSGVVEVAISVESL